MNFHCAPWVTVKHASLSMLTPVVLGTSPGGCVKSMPHRPHDQAIAQLQSPRLKNG